MHNLKKLIKKIQIYHLDKIKQKLIKCFLKQQIQENKTKWNNKKLNNKNKWNNLLKIDLVKLNKTII